MHSKYYLTPEIKPDFTLLGNIQFTADDVMFDWTRFEIPVGTAAIKSTFAKINGLDAAAATFNFDLFFAAAVDGVAPPSIGTNNSGKNIILTTAAKPFIIGMHSYLMNDVEDAANSLVGYNVLGTGKPASNVALDTRPVFLQGTPYAGTTPGYQSIWVAATSTQTPTFGTACLVAGAHAADDLTIVVDGTDTDDLFFVGEEVVAFANDGSSPLAIGTVTAVAADLLTVDACPSILPDNHEICTKHPMVFRFGMEI